VRRRLLNLLTTLSLLLCVASVAAWVRSYAACDGVGYTQVGAAGPGIPVREWNGLVSRGVVCLSWVDYVWNGGSNDLPMHSGPNKIGNWWRRIRLPPEDLPTDFWFRDTFLHRRGFAAISQNVPSVRPPGRIGILAFPLWLPACLCAALPVKRLVRRVPKAPAPGLCPSCGYDLRATPGRCPECGKMAPAAPAT